MGAFLFYLSHKILSIQSILCWCCMLNASTRSFIGLIPPGWPLPSETLREFCFVSHFFHVSCCSLGMFSFCFLFLEHKAALTWWTCTQYILWWKMSLRCRRDWTICCRNIARAATSEVPSCAPTLKVLPGRNMWTLPPVMSTQSKERPFSVCVLRDLNIDGLLPMSWKTIPNVEA